MLRRKSRQSLKKASSDSVSVTFFSSLTYSLSLPGDCQTKTFVVVHTKCTTSVFVFLSETLVVVIPLTKTMVYQISELSEP